MKEFYEANKGSLKAALIMIIATIIILIVTSVVDNLRNATTPKKVLDTLAKTYYEDAYYPNIKESNPYNYTEVLSETAQEGLKMSVKRFMSIYTELDFSLFKEGKYSSCDFDLTYVTIYPKAPYGPKDYTLKENIFCNIKSVEEKTDVSGNRVTSNGGK